VAAVLGVSGLAFEARIAAGRDTRVMCSGDGRTLSTALARAMRLPRARKFRRRGRPCAATPRRHVRGGISDHVGNDPVHD